jgi:hypothetical protein
MPIIIVIAAGAAAAPGSARVPGSAARDRDAAAAASVARGSRCRGFQWHAGFVRHTMALPGKVRVALPVTRTRAGVTPRCPPGPVTVTRLGEYHASDSDDAAPAAAAAAARRSLSHSG